MENNYYDSKSMATAEAQDYEEIYPDDSFCKHVLFGRKACVLVAGIVIITLIFLGIVYFG